MAATCTLTAPPDLFRVCNQGPWVERQTQLRFLFAGRLVAAVRFNTMLLDAPFTHVRSDDSELPPPPAAFPPGVEAARVYCCPVGPNARPIALVTGAMRYVSAAYRHFYIDLAGSFDDYLQKFSSKSRSTLKRKVKKFAAASGVAQPFREFTLPGEMDEFHRLAAQVSQKTYQHRLLDAGIPAGADYGQQLRELASRGRLRGYVLLDGDTPVSYNLCIGAGSTLTLDKTGFDPEYARSHPGTVLTYLTIARLFEENRFRVYDFGSGDFRYKEFFATGNVRCADILYLNRTFRNLAVVLAHLGLSRLTEAVKSFLTLLGINDRIKKLIHYGI